MRISFKSGINIIGHILNRSRLFEESGYLCYLSNLTLKILKLLKRVLYLHTKHHYKRNTFPVASCFPYPKLAKHKLVYCSATNIIFVFRSSVCLYRHIAIMSGTSINLCLLQTLPNHYV